MIAAAHVGDRETGDRIKTDKLREIAEREDTVGVRLCHEFP